MNRQIMNGQLRKQKMTDDQLIKIIQSIDWTKEKAIEELLERIEKK